MRQTKHAHTKKKNVYCIVTQYLLLIYTCNKYMNKLFITMKSLRWSEIDVLCKRKKECGGDLK